MSRSLLMIAAAGTLLATAPAVAKQWNWPRA
jgi:hypothetical protein